MNPIPSLLTLTTKVFSLNNNNEGSFAYKSVPLKNSNLFATVKVNLFKVGCLFPYVSAGLGFSWIQAHNNQYLNFSFVDEEQNLFA
jgi:hypothetical protein